MPATSGAHAAPPDGPGWEWKAVRSACDGRAGQSLLVIGSPLGLGGSVSTGSVSALRDIDGVNYIQFSAPVSPGNSGGPVVNGAGEVIGITVAKANAAGAEGIGFAIPVNQVCVQLHVC